jgi:hypothetical protein
MECNSKITDTSTDKIIVLKDVSTSLCRGVLPGDMAQKVFDICQTR